MVETNSSKAKPTLQERISILNGFLVVHLQHLDRRATDRRSSDKPGAVPFKMVRPGVEARVEQASKFAVHRIEPRKVRAFVEIASHTCQREVRLLGLTAMLLGNDVVDLEWDFRESFGESAVFASATGPASHTLLESGVQARVLLRQPGVLQSQVSFGLQTDERGLNRQVVFKLLLLHGSQGASTGFGRKGIHTFQVGIRELPAQHGTGFVRRQFVVLGVDDALPNRRGRRFDRCRTHGPTHTGARRFFQGLKGALPVVFGNQGRIPCARINSFRRSVELSM